jgi:hypothetical protein
MPQSESMGRVSRDARLLFIMLWTICDDSGRTRAASRMLASLLFPYDDDAPSKIDGWLSELEAERCIDRYAIDGNTYIQVRNWLIHQKIDKPTPSKIPKFEEKYRILANPREDSSEDQGRDQGEERKGSKDSSSLRSDSSSPSDDDPEVAADEVKKSEGASPPADLAARKAERLRQVTLDAIAAFNEILGRPNGLLPAVSAKVGLERRLAQVKRCLRVARQICGELLKSQTVTREFWDAYFAQCDRDDFKSGRQPPGKGHENWTPSFEYLTREAVMLDVFEKATSAPPATEAAA